MREKAGKLALLILCFTLLPLSSSAGNAAGVEAVAPAGLNGVLPQELKEALSASVQTRSLQTELPVIAVEPRAMPAETPETGERSAAFPPRAEAEPSHEADGRRTLPALSAGAATYILYAVLISFLVVMLLLVPRNLWSFSRARRVGGERGPAAPAGSPSHAACGFEHEADRLAHAGDYVEAMHLLLLEGVAEVIRASGRPISRSLTSREILRHSPLSDDGAAAFADIVRRVEVSYYGYYRPGLQDYEACRRSFEALYAALAGGVR